MKKANFLLYLLCFSSVLFAQVNSNQWTWMHGDDFLPQHPVYGTKGVAAPKNKIGARSAAVSWMDTSGRLWVFGGADPNDLWMYEPASGLWTWMSGDSSVNDHAAVYGIKGIAAPANTPGERNEAVSWTDASGNLWLFGGYSYAFNPYSYLNDLWKYNPSTGLWTWMGGENTGNKTGTYGIKGIAASANKPGARSGAVSWTDTAGNLWLFGGYGYGNSAPGALNDLWKYNPSAGQWTWVSGDSTGNQQGVYGIKRIAAPGNKPGGRSAAVGWTDTSGNLWLFGAAQSIALNDLWKYTPSTGQWTWMSGDSTINQKGEYGTKGTAAPSNKPGARYHAIGWGDAAGNLLLFGGWGYVASSLGNLNDLWKYTLSSGQWTWVGGDSTIDKKASYGTKGEASASNDPGARAAAVGKTDAAGNLWLMGGQGYAPGNTTSYANALDDLWKYEPSTGLWTWISGDDRYAQVGVYGTKGLPSPKNKPGARKGAVSWADTSNNLWLFGGAGYSADNVSMLNDLWKYAPSTSQWTWMGGDTITNQTGVYGIQGIASPANKPGARLYAVSCTDRSGSLWLFGGTTGSFLNDLWRYEPSTGLWTWVSGDKTADQMGVYGTKGIAAPSNKPGARDAAVSWTDSSGNLWLFGGYSFITITPRLTYPALFNDLWKFDPSTGQWTWMSGSNGINSRSVYGTKGIAAPANTPGARQKPVSWTDASGNLWMFGGYGEQATSGSDKNDLWKYTLSNGQWTWMSGDSIGYQKGVYGTKGISAPGNKPGARTDAVGWTDASGDLWLFGGLDNSSGTGSRYLNELWRYSPATGQWAWMSGDTTLNIPGVYGMKGIATPANKPGGRGSLVSWTDTSGNLWLFGGTGYSTAFTDYLNDLWKYTMPAASLPVQFSSFSARRQLQHVLLNWTTAQEQNSRCFVIERSATGARYDSIGTVAASGTVSTVTRYTFTDTDPLQGDTFYRLKELDLDGRSMFSKVAKIYMDEAAAGFTIIQNPVQSTLQLQVRQPAARKMTLQIRSINGHLLQSEERMGSNGSTMYALPVGHLAKGIYLINMQTEKLNITKTFIKQ